MFEINPSVMMWLLTQNKARNIFHSILSSDKGYVDKHCIIDILYYNENYNNKNSDKLYIAVCLLVTLNQ